MGRYMVAVLLWGVMVVGVSGRKRLETGWNEGVGSLEIKGNEAGGAIPWIKKGGTLTIEFDLIEGLGSISAGGWERVTYKVVHCDGGGSGDEDRGGGRGGGWEQSQLMETEYMQGFQDLVVTEMESGRGTTVSYTHYSLSLPNEEVELKVSGNYAVMFFKESGEWLATGCFCVCETKTECRGSVTGNTLRDTYAGSQQLDFSIETKGLGQGVRERDLQVTVYKNGRRDDAVRRVKPSGLAGSRLDYVNVRELIFAAGNEFRRCEFLTPRGQGMRVEEIGVFEGFYHVTLVEDKVREGYLYDRDMNGGFLVNCLPCRYPSVEADYFFVHFRLVSPQLTGGEVYLSGGLSGYAFREANRMHYEGEGNYYEQCLLLKQGQYNYEYLFVPRGGGQALTAPLEGDFYQTENEYSVYVYYRPLGEKYDRLVGVHILK
ncbi:MAG: DUF5103 domain-containing protein [Tannerellaceae bacterium]|jgi:hypothetical protein|nr:DUF5103 domain-containing protein [Tannerellaceae bacterium]